MSMSLSYVQRAAISIFTLFPIATGIAGTVFDQPTKLPHHVCDDCWTSDRGEDGEWRSFDDFQLPLKTVVTEVYWQGTYWHTQDESVNPVEPDTNEWEIAFFPSRTIQDRSFPDTRSNSKVYRESIFADEVDSGTSTLTCRPPAAPKPAMDEPPLPELSSSTEVMPCWRNMESITEEPRSLNEPVGANHSSLKEHGNPEYEPATRGVQPSPMVMGDSTRKGYAA